MSILIFKNDITLPITRKVIVKAGNAYALSGTQLDYQIVTVTANRRDIGMVYVQPDDTRVVEVDRLVRNILRLAASLIRDLRNHATPLTFTYL